MMVLYAVERKKIIKSQLDLIQYLQLVVTESMALIKSKYNMPSEDVLLSSKVDDMFKEIYNRPIPSETDWNLRPRLLLRQYLKQLF